MNIRVEETLPEAAIHFLKRCYKFVSQEWQHAVREPLPDQGFEQRFRESCVINLTEWNISIPPGWSGVIVIAMLTRPIV